MFPFLFWIPAAVSLVLGVVYLLFGDGRPVFKILGALVFLVAVYLQFFSSLALAGLILQSILAFCLALWRKIDRSI